MTADFDGDGVTDFAVGNHLGDSVSVFRGLGDGTFAPTDVLALPAGSGLFDLQRAASTATATSIS